MTLRRLIKESVEEVCRVCTNGQHYGLGCDARMVSSLDGWKSPWGKSLIPGDDDLEEFLTTFRALMECHWLITDTLDDICKESISRNYDSDAVALNKVVVENLAIVLETSTFISGISRAAIRWSTAVTAVHHSRKSGKIHMGLRFISDLAEIADLSETTTRLSRLLEFGKANGFDSEILLAQAQSWDRPDSIIRGLIHALSIDVNCDEPLYALSGME